MQKIQVFNTSQLKDVENAVLLAEELVNNYFKMSSNQWLGNRYDVKTLENLTRDEIIEGPFAQVIGYEARKNVHFSSSSYNYYTICLQDNAILRLLEKKKELFLPSFLLYILIHELVHIVRFSKFEQIYENSVETKHMINEERIVHDITCKIIEKVSIIGKDDVLQYYKKWRLDQDFKKLL
ncbi:MAG: hypothetical protein B6I26_04220 [Desulfobacteraceae bacterium 4572_130]|nr:MAG: hypothetical protein B6I26_04220 [Desulfobacteraceae bacterium 4572_130]